MGDHRILLSFFIVYVHEALVVLKDNATCVNPLYLTKLMPITVSYPGPLVFHGMRIFRGIRRLPQNLLFAAENRGIAFCAAFILIQGCSVSFLILHL